MRGAFDRYLPTHNLSKYKFPEQIQFLVNDLRDVIKKDLVNNKVLSSWAKYCSQLLNLERQLWFYIGTSGDYTHIVRNFPTLEAAREFKLAFPNIRQASSGELDEVRILTDLLLNFDELSYSQKYDLKISKPPIRSIPALLGSYALFLVFSGYSNKTSNNIIQAGRLLGKAQQLTQWENVGNPTPSQIGRKGMEARWGGLQQIKNEIRRKWLEENWTTKAELIRAVKDDVLKIAKEEANTTLKVGNVERTIRTWLDGL